MNDNEIFECLKHCANDDLIKCVRCSVPELAADIRKASTNGEKIHQPEQTPELRGYCRPAWLKSINFYNLAIESLLGLLVAFTIFAFIYIATL